MANALPQAGVTQPPRQWLPVALIVVATVATGAGVRPVARAQVVSSAVDHRPTRGIHAPPVQPAARAPVRPDASCRDRSGACAPLATYKPGPARTPAAARLNWLRTGADKPTRVQEAQAAGLSGDATPGNADYTPPPFGQGRPVWLSLGALWCKPCKAELGDVVAAVAALGKGRALADQPHLVVVLGETAAGHSLARARKEMLSDHARIRPDQGPLTVPPWMQFRADLLNRWPPAIAALLGKSPDALSLPVNAVFDRCGNLWDVHQGAVSRAILHRFAQRLRWSERLNARGQLPCSAARSQLEAKP